MTPQAWAVGKEAFLSSLTFYKECYCHCYIESGTQSIFDSLGELSTKNVKKANKKKARRYRQEKRMIIDVSNLEPTEHSNSSLLVKRVNCPSFAHRYVPANAPFGTRTN